MILHAFAFLLLCGLLFLLPLVPALREWRLKRDADPLKVVRDYDGNIEHFAHGFRHFLVQHFPDLAADGTVPSSPAVPLDPGSFALVGADGVPGLTAAELAARACSRLLIASGPLTLGEDVFYEKELYAGAGLQSGPRNSFRAILAEGDITLGSECAVLRWAHSGASVHVGERSRLYGRVSAAGQITLERGTRFGRMAAPEIRFGQTATALPAGPWQAKTQALPVPGKLLDQSAHRWLVNGVLSIPAHTSHCGNLVARGQVSIGDRTSIHGDIKSNGDLLIGDDVHIDGALVATGRLVIGARCVIKGPVVGDAQVTLGSGTVIGKPGMPTTVTAAEIRVEEGVLAHGTVWAREVGLVVAERP